ncbi:MAG: hypothetical protein K9M36_01335 [Candidatus Pacebacteria bacterium]|nr:hypothetical protein [Candidatus Paceibacterota bacterium]
MTEKITSSQENRLTDLFRDGLRALNLSKEEAQEIIKSGGEMQKQIKPILQKLAMVDQRFGPAIKDFEFTVPSDYKHDTQLDTFAGKTKLLSTTYYFNDALTSKNFAKATNELEPSKKYRVRIFPILATVTSEDCMRFLAKQHAILVGGQGLTLLQANKPDEFPVGKYTVSFDEKDSLWKDSDGYRRVPLVFRCSDGGCWFLLGDFGLDWVGVRCLLCFCDL